MADADVEPTIVLLRGLARGKDHWLDFESQVKQVYEYDRIVSVDIAGNGQRFEEPSSYSIDAMVDDVSAQLSLHNVKPPYHVVALSLGAMVVLQWMHRNDDVAKAILINTSHAGLSHPWQRMFFPSMLHLICALWQSPEKAEAAIFNLTANLAEPKNTVARWVDIAHSHPIRRSNILRQVIAASTFKQRLILPENRILLLSSQQDHLVNPLCSQHIANTYNIKLHSHLHAGHDLTLDDPAWVLKQMQQWFS